MTQTLNLTAPYEDVDRVSKAALKAIEDEEMGLAVLGIALTLGRLLAVGELNKVNEADFVSAVLDYAGAFVATSEGIAN